MRVRTYCFPGVLRGRPEPRLATTPTSRPRRSQSSPGLVFARLSIAPRRGFSPAPVGISPSRLGGTARPLTYAPMRTRSLAVATCLAGLVAGCGSGSSKTQTSAPPAISGLPRTLALGSPPSGTSYTAVNHAFLQRLATVLGHSLESEGLHSVNVTCTASVPQRAICQANGVSDRGQPVSGSLRVRIDRKTGQARVTPT